VQRRELLCASSEPQPGNGEIDNPKNSGKKNQPGSSISATFAASTSAAATTADSSSSRIRRQRLQVAGVSVSPSGFHVVLQKNASHYLPLRVTDDASADREAATSPQALTILQLLARVDMAGAILPPDVLSRIVVLALEDDDAELLREQGGGFGSQGVGKGEEDRDNEDRRSRLSQSAAGAQFLRLVRERLGKLQQHGSSATTYGELHEYPWLQSRVSLPTVTLDGLILSLSSTKSPPSTLVYKLECSVKNLPGGLASSALSVDLTEPICENVAYEYHPEGISRAFVALALAMRYRAPIELLLLEQDEPDGAFLTLDQVTERFPLYRTSDQLRQTPERVTINIERGLKVNQLQAALRMALEREDFVAATKIRAALDEMDSLEDLPTQPESDTGSMQ
jgi:hypothetical protein